MTTTIGATKAGGDHMVYVDLTNCAYDDTYTLNLATGGATPEACIHGQVNQFDIGMDNLNSVSVYSTTISMGNSGTVNRPAGGTLYVITKPDEPILQDCTITVTSSN